MLTKPLASLLVHRMTWALTYARMAEAPKQNKNKNKIDTIASEFRVSIHIIRFAAAAAAATAAAVAATMQIKGSQGSDGVHRVQIKTHRGCVKTSWREDAST